MIDRKNKINRKMYAFNAWNLSSAKSIVKIAKKLDRVIYLQISSKVFKTLNPYEFIIDLKNYMDRNNITAIVHLDHSSDLDEIRIAIDAGWDSVMFDGSNLSIDENIYKSNKVINLAKEKNVLVEGEIGKIYRTSSSSLQAEENNVSIEDIKKYLNATNLDLLAVAIGTKHGQYGCDVPNINYNLIHEISKISNIPFVVHGGSELTCEVLSKLWKFDNVKKINISTDLKQSYRRAITDAILENELSEEGFNPMEIERRIENYISNCITYKMKVLEELNYE